MKKIILLFFALFIVCTPAHAEYGNSPVHWGIKKAENEVPAEAGKQLDVLLERHGAVYKGSSHKKDIYLTFDNGYENGYTGQILDVLKKEQVPAAFFITGHYLNTAPDLVKRMAAEGHTIGNHSWTHPDMTTVSREKFTNELEKVRVQTEKLTGIKEMPYLRPPRGIFSERTLALAKEEGYAHIFWSLAYVDWKTDQQRGWQYSYDNIMKQIHPGSILLLHTVSKDNADALEKAIKDLKKRGYTFKTLDDLMWSQAIHEPMLY
ncbi:delta-lactam-biosynthetic de-N-acetylase [Cytobacillus horneckiae]|uniref:Delta-lactam-biosynthetic de-N-acetylase n=1 Tax=Cytobacillus horneckiae TaxID=549687 RepID=A0A2N0ZK53_9BACI|nr:delta-lactam-biosynthetic de-N-acetylase [Cytobacillus horneckiae]MEC1154752.1 delta-lactam-biosynthetic de-N-acetylase [Cytobacillus horneckiae]MED2940245.1 delta-lactam-biosynthetic de-N-acetylase [Cytobacillus horneckiae]PKG29902.1 delta-lactam-biosynthetic de-N-acetylase [Cytobacillus horneckiae]